MQTEKLTKGQEIALSTFLSSFENVQFEKLLHAIRVEDYQAITIWEPVEYMSAEILADTIANLAVAIDGNIQTRAQK